MRDSRLALTSAVMAMMACAVMATMAGCAASRTAPRADACTLTEADKAANARLSFGAFDQAATIPTTARALSVRGCHAAAAAAQEDYLARAALDDERARTSLIFHLAQYLAQAGRPDDAAAVIVTARRLVGGSDPAFDWNAYVIGTWAFLKRDRALLDERYRHLKALSGHPNQTNARVLGGLLRCFDRPYAQAYTPACAGP